MKKLYVGIGLLLTSSIIYGSSLITAAIYSQILTSNIGEGWSSKYGIFGSALLETSTFSLLVATAALIIASILIISSVKEK